MTVKVPGRSRALLGVVAVTVAGTVLSACGPGHGAASTAASPASVGTASVPCASAPSDAVAAGSTTVAGPDGALVHNHPGAALPPNWPGDVRLPAGADVVASAVVVQPCGYQLRADLVAPVGAGALLGSLTQELRSQGYRPRPAPPGLGTAATALGRGGRLVVVSVTPIGDDESTAVVAIPRGVVDLVAGDT